MIDGAEYFLPNASAYPQVKIGGKDVDVRELLTIDVNNLVADYATITHWTTTIGYKLEAVESAVSREKRALVRVEAEATLRIRSETPKATESTLKAMVALDGLVQAQQDKLDAASFNAGVFKVLLRAVESKRDMVVNMGAEIRKRNK